MTNLVTIVSAVVPLFSVMSAIAIWYADMAVNRNNMRRDYNHLKTNYDQIDINLDFLSKENDRRFDDMQKDLMEIKSCLIYSKENQ